LAFLFSVRFVWCERRESSSQFGLSLSLFVGCSGDRFSVKRKEEKEKEEGEICLHKVGFEVEACRHWLFGLAHGKTSVCTRDAVGMSTGARRLVLESSGSRATGPAEEAGLTAAVVVVAGGAAAA
jgi:hypothetical protein